MLTSWLGRRLDRQSKNANRRAGSRFHREEGRRRRMRLALEALEDRLAPATASQFVISGLPESTAVGPSGMGTYEVDAGTLTLGGGASGTATYEVDASALLDFQGTEDFTAGSISGAGQVEFDGPTTVATTDSISGTTDVLGSVAFNGPVNINGSQLIDNGTVNLTAAELASPLSLGGVYLNGTLLINSELTIAGPGGFAPPPVIANYLQGVPGTLATYGFCFLSGTLGGSGTVYLDTTSLLGWPNVNLNVSVVNNNDATIGGDIHTLGAGVSLTNAAGATLQVESGGVLNGSGAVVNQAGGTVLEVASPGEKNFNVLVPFTNAGLVEVESGTLTIGGASCSSSGSIIGDPGTILNFDGAALTLTPAAQITADSLVLDPATLNVQISGSASATGYPSITANAPATASQFNLELLNGFTPSLGETFTLINNQGSVPINGTFASLPEGVTVWSGRYGFTITYAGGAGGKDVVLTLTQVLQYSISVAVASDHPSGSVYGQAVTLIATVSATSASSVTPTGSVQFLVDGSNDGSPVSLVGGSGSVMASRPAGSHTVTADYTSDDPSFASSDSAPFTATVSPATATIVVTPYSVTYDGNAHIATGTTTGVGGINLIGDLTLSGTTHTNAGTYNGDAWKFHDATGDHQDASGMVNDSIGQASASITVTPYSVTYDGNAHTAAATAIGVGGVNLIGDLTLGGTTHTNAGTYNGDAWSFHDPTGNYNNASGTVIDSISTLGSIFVLDHTAGGALTLSGNASISIPGNLVVDSNSKTALTESGTAQIKAGGIQVVGGVSKSGNATLSPAAATGVAVVADPLAGLAVPTVTPGAPYTGALISESLSGNSTGSIGLGLYSQISVSGNASLKLASGTYIVQGGGVTLSGNASVSCPGVTFIVAGGRVLGFRQRRDHRGRRDDLQRRQPLQGQYGSRWRHLRLDHFERQRQPVCTQLRGLHRNPDLPGPR